MSQDWSDDGLSLGELGPGWEQVDRALADIQADFSRTVAGAPKIVLLWRELDEDRDASDAMVAEFSGPNARIAFVGKARDWYYGSGGGFALTQSYPSAVLGIADQLSDAVADSLLDELCCWPLCPPDGHLLTVLTDFAGRCWWSCADMKHLVAEVGQLPGLDDTLKT